MNMSGKGEVAGKMKMVPPSLPAGVLAVGCSATSMSTEDHVPTSSYIPAQDVVCCSLKIKCENYGNEKSKHQHEGGTEGEAHLTFSVLNWLWILKTTGCYQELKLGDSSCNILILKGKEDH